MPIIVGVDTGKTAALACLDLSGNLVRITTQRYGGISWFVEEMRTAGLPVVIASDKRRADGTPSKLATIFDAVLFTPGYDISVKRKNAFIRHPGVENTHERDALAAAKTAYNAYRNKLSQTERLGKQNNYTDLNKLKAMVIRKYSVHDVLTNSKSGRRLVR